MAPTCPKCGSTRVHRSHRLALAERVASVLGGKIKRCHECNFRFVQIHGSTLLLADFRRVVRKLAWVALIAAALAMVLAVVLWFSGKQASFSPGDSGVLLISWRPSVERA